MSGRPDFTEFAQARWPTYLRAAILLGHDPDEAQDIAQMTLARCFARWSKVSSADDIDAYAYRVFLNVHNAEIRRRRIRVTAPPNDAVGSPVPGLPVGQSSFDTVDDRAALDAALNNLSQGARAVVVLRVFQDLSEAQTAHILGMPVGTVKSRLARGLAALRNDVHLQAFNKGEA